jgi:hypothetical protein
MTTTFDIEPCEFCGKKDCYDDQCYMKKHRKDSYGLLFAILQDKIGQPLTAFNVTKDGGKAMLTFGDKTVVIGAGGNLWDEAFPVFREIKEGD